MSLRSRPGAPLPGRAPRLSGWQILRRQVLRCLALAGALIAMAILGVAPVAAAQPPGDAAANLAAGGKLDAALALLDTWLADHPDDPRVFPALLQVVAAAPQPPTVDAVVGRYRSRLGGDEVAVLRAVPADLAELSGGVEQALQALELPGVRDAAARRAVLLLEVGEVTPDTAPAGMPMLHAGLARSGEGLGEAGLEPSLRAAFNGPDVAAGIGGAVAGYGLVSLLAANGRADEAAVVLEQMRRRYPRSPEYALAAAELQAGAVAPQVVALPSPAMLLGSLVGACRAPCPAPAGALLARDLKPAPPRPAAALPDVGRMVALLAAPAPERPSAAAVPPSQRAEQLASGAQPPRAEPEPAAPRAAFEPPAFVAAPVAGEPAELVPLPEPGLPVLAAAQAAAGAEPALLPPAAKLQAVLAAAPPAPEPLASVAAAAPPAERAAPVPAAVAVVAVQSDPSGAAAAVPAPESTASVATAAPRAERAAPAPAAAGVMVAAQPEPAGAAADGPHVRVSSRPSRPVTVAAEGAVDSITSRVSALLGPVAGAALAAPATSGGAVVRVAAQPDPAAFIVQTGSYRDPDNALAVEHQLAEAGFAALARSYRLPGGIVHRVTVGGNMTQTQAERLVARLRDAGYESNVARRDDVSHLPPPPPTR